jgi:hypothetical protein
MGDALSNVDHYTEEVEQAVGIVHVVYRIEQPQFKREGDTIRQFDVSPYILLVLEALQVKSKNVGKFLDLHAADITSISSAGAVHKYGLAVFLPLVDRNKHHRRTCSSGKASRLR